VGGAPGPRTGRRRRLRPAGVRARTTLLATVVVALALLLGAVTLVLVLDRALTRSGDDAARARVADLAALASAGALPATLPVTGEDDVAQVVGPEGRVVTASATLRDAGPLLARTPVIPGPRGGDPTVATVEDVPDGAEREAYRVWAARAGTPDGPVTVSVGTSLESVRETVTTLQTVLAVGLPPLLALLALTTWVVVGRALRPVEAIRAEVADVSVRALDRRVPVPSGDDEVARLARTMNAMLDRLEEASTRQRAFVADASHELQGPLAALRAELEVALTRPGATDWAATARALLDDSARLERLVRDLLFLARTDEAPVPERRLVDLDDVVLEEATRVRGTAPVPVDTRDVSAAPVHGSRDELARLARNLLDNAARHARTRVRVSLAVVAEGSAAEGSAGAAAGDGSSDGGTADTVVVLTVTDDGPGVPAGARERVFDRFVRLDDARTPSDDARTPSDDTRTPAGEPPVGAPAAGTGLGLAIVRAVAGRHGGTVAVEDAEPGARFVVRLPPDVPTAPRGSRRSGVAAGPDAGPPPGVGSRRPA
jgi:signal transduction histidine kinase